MNRPQFNITVTFEEDRLSSPGKTEVLLKEYLYEQYDLLKLSVSVPDISVIIRKSGGSGMEGNIMTVCPDAEHGEQAFSDSLELLFKHEITHLLAEIYCSYISPVIFWEGIPVYFSDHRVRSRTLGISYHVYCRAFMVSDHLLPLSDFVFGSDYYTRRTDFRIDLQAGSFTGFLIEKHGITALLDGLKTVPRPTPENPVLQLNPFLKSVYRKDFFQLEKDWHIFLRDENPGNASLEQKFAQYSAPPEFTDHKHCPFCFSPSDIKESKCPECGADKNISLKLL